MPKKTIKKITKKTTVKKTVRKTPTKTISDHRKATRKTQSKVNKKTAPNTSKIVPDTSVLVEGILSKEIQGLEIKEIIIHEAALAELESQANKRKESGYLGLDEVEKLRTLSKSMGFKLSIKGERPRHFEITYAKSGEIDSLIRSLAESENAVLYTGDVVQAKVAKARGIPTILLDHKIKKIKMDIENFFDETTMSVHIKENCSIFSKRGRPGEWEFHTVKEEPVRYKDVERWAKQIIEAAHLRRDGFVEIERKGSTIVQVGNYRIVITKPPFADGYEITAVRPVKHLYMKDYSISAKLQQRLDKQAEGILIAGAPGQGKSTFAQALAEYYNDKKKIIKTVEAPRDLVLPEEITQYAISHGSSEEVHDILLLSRPDYTFFDEMRNTEDFKLFADMRLSGVGMIGVIHGTKTIDAIQRFIGRIELGVIPHVIDTVLFIQNGTVARVYSIKMIVKVPSGMTEADLARPVVEIHDFENDKLEFEIYTYGEQTVVIPVSGTPKKNSVLKHAEEGLKKYFQKYSRSPQLELVNDKKLIVRVDDNEKAAIIGKGGERIQAIERELGLSIDVESKKPEKKVHKPGALPFKVNETKSTLSFDLGTTWANRSVDLLIEGDYIMTAHASKKGKVKLSKRGSLIAEVLKALDNSSLSIKKSD